MDKVFLGGTCADSTWREELIGLLEIVYFNPVVDDWNEDCKAEELHQREVCDYCLYVITPRMQGYYSLAEVIDDSNKRPEKTVFCVLAEDGWYAFEEKELHSLTEVGKMVVRNGGIFTTDLQDVANYLNGGGK